MWNRATDRTADFLTPQLMAIGRVQSVKISTHAAEEDDPARGRRQAALHGIVGHRQPQKDRARGSCGSARVRVPPLTNRANNPRDSNLHREETAERPGERRRRASGPIAIRNRSGMEAVDAHRRALYMSAIPNVFWVPAPVTSAWDFLRLGSTRQGPASTGRWVVCNRRARSLAAEMEIGPWRA